MLIFAFVFLFLCLCHVFFHSLGGCVINQLLCHMLHLQPVTDSSSHITAYIPLWTRGGVYFIYFFPRRIKVKMILQKKF